MASAPIAKNGRYGLNIGGFFDGQLVATDGDGDAFTYAISKPPKVGSAVILDATGSANGFVALGCYPRACRFESGTDVPPRPA